MYATACRSLQMSGGTVKKVIANKTPIARLVVAGTLRFLCVACTKANGHQMYRPQFLPCIEKCQDCATACERCVTAWLCKVDEIHRSSSILLAMDCARLCRETSSLMARCSDFAGVVCEICEMACQRCQESCEKHPEEHSQHCAKACRLCAAECRRMLASLSHGPEDKPTGGPYAA